jgi:deoxycytidylate deaminase
MQRPTYRELNDALPIKLWHLAEFHAKRSTHRKHKTGAIIFDSDGGNFLERPKILAAGCAHAHNGGMAIHSIHAEQHAISRWPKSQRVEGCVCLIVTLTRNGNFASISKPCANCASLLAQVVREVIYAERTNDGSWLIRSENPRDIQNLCRTKSTKEVVLNA